MTHPVWWTFPTARATLKTEMLQLHLMEKKREFLPPIKKRLIWAKYFYPGQFHSHFSSAQNQQNPHRRLTVSRPTRRIRGPRLTAVNLCRLFGRTEPRAAEQDCRRQLGKSRFAPVRNVTRCGSRIAAFLWVGVDYLPLERASREVSRSRNATPGCPIYPTLNI